MNSHSLNVNTFCKCEYIFTKNWTDPFWGTKNSPEKWKGKKYILKSPPPPSPRGPTTQKLNGRLLIWKKTTTTKQEAEEALLVHDRSSPSISDSFPSWRDQNPIDGGYNGGQKCWDLSSDITKTSDPSPPTPNKVEFGAKWVKLSAFFGHNIARRAGGRRNEPKAEQKNALRSRILRNYCLQGLFHTVPSSFVLHCSSAGRVHKKVTRALLVE